MTLFAPQRAFSLAVVSPCACAKLFAMLTARDGQPLSCLQRIGDCMPSLKLAFPHQLGQEEAVARLKNLLTKVKDKYQDQVSNLSESWNENTLTFSFTTYGFKVAGDVIVEPTEVRLDGQIPFAAMVFIGKIESALREQLARHLA